MILMMCAAFEGKHFIENFSVTLPASIYLLLYLDEEPNLPKIFTPCWSCNYLLWVLYHTKSMNFCFPFICSCCMWWIPTSSGSASSWSAIMSGGMTKLLSSQTMCLHWNTMPLPWVNPIFMAQHLNLNGCRSCRTSSTTQKWTRSLWARLQTHHLTFQKPMSSSRSHLMVDLDDKRLSVSVAFFVPRKVLYLAWCKLDDLSWHIFASKVFSPLRSTCWGIQCLFLHPRFPRHNGDVIFPKEAAISHQPGLQLQGCDSATRHG